MGLQQQQQENQKRVVELRMSILRVAWSRLLVSWPLHFLPLPHPRRRTCSRPVALYSSILDSKPCVGQSKEGAFARFTRVKK